jgi:hypothetical protein
METTEKGAVGGDPEVGNDLEGPSKPLQRLTTPRVWPVNGSIGLFQRSRCEAGLSPGGLEMLAPDEGQAPRVKPR